MKYDYEYPARVRKRCEVRGYKLPAAVELSFEGTKFTALAFRTGEQNYKLAKIALIALLGYNPFEVIDGEIYFEKMGGTIDFFRAS